MLFGMPAILGFLPLVMNRELSEHGRKKWTTQQKPHRPWLDNSIARNCGWFVGTMGKASVLSPSKVGSKR